MAHVTNKLWLSHLTGTIRETNASRWRIIQKWRLHIFSGKQKGRRNRIFTRTDRKGHSHHRILLGSLHFSNSSHSFNSDNLANFGGNSWKTTPIYVVNSTIKVVFIQQLGQIYEKLIYIWFAERFHPVHGCLFWSCERQCCRFADFVARSSDFEQHLDIFFYRFETCRHGLTYRSCNEVKFERWGYALLVSKILSASCHHKRRHP